MDVPLIASEWEYRIEGALHMVLGYRGSHPPFLHKILRLETGDGTITSQPIQEENRFIRTVFGSHFGPYIEPGQLLPVTPQFLSQVSEQVDSQRPESRKKKGRIQMDQKFVLLQADFCKLYSEYEDGTYTVEIKPKCGSCSRSKLVEPEVCKKLGKFTTLTYFVKNFPEESFDVARGLYDPSELLSGEKRLVEKALRGLVGRTAHTIRAFHEEEAVFADFLEEYDDSKVAGKVAQALEDGANPSNGNVANGASTEGETSSNDGTSISTSALQKVQYAQKAFQVAKLVFSRASNVLQTILKCQKLDFVDDLGAEIVYDHLIKLLSEEKAGEAIWKAHFEERDAGKFTRAMEALSYKSPEEGAQQHNQKQYEAACQYVQNLDAKTSAAILSDFLIAGTAKDCSIMISMAAIKDKSVEEKALLENEGLVEVQKGEWWKYCINVVDLEPKAVSRIRNWANRDRKRMKQSFNVIKS